MLILKAVSLTATLLLFTAFPSGQTKPQTDVWEPLKFLVGHWEGVGNGKSGLSKVQREYRFVLNGKYLNVQSRSVYDPQPKNPKGETHEELGMISFDKGGKQFRFRQFHVEGFVIEYVSSSVDDKAIVFTSESVENGPAGWRARETYKIVSPDEFVEVFELAGQGKEFEVYTENRLQRKK